MLKILRTLTSLILLIASISVFSFAEEKLVLVDEEHAVVTVEFDIKSGSEYRLAVVHGEHKQFYPLVRSSQRFSLPFGDGTYTVAVYEKVQGKSYKLCKKDSFNVDIDEKSQYLASVYDISWTQDDAIVKKAKQLTDGAQSDQEKVERIYAFVTNTINYDYSKVTSISYGYIPNLEQTLSSKRGICYDYASLTAAMLRSVDVPTQLCMGYSNELSVYHAWNKVYVDGQWKVIDTTIDSVNESTNTGHAIYRDESKYSTEKIF